MRYFKHILSLLLLLSAITAHAVTFRAQAPSQVMVGMEFEISFVLSGSDRSASNISVPQLSGAKRLNNDPMVSQGFSRQIYSNGQGSPSQSSSSYIAYTFRYIASSAGRHTLGPATVTVNGKRYSSQPVTIEVLSSPYQSQAPQQQQAPPQQQSNVPADLRELIEQIAGRDVTSNDFFVKITISKDVVYEQEAVMCHIKLYSRFPLGSFHCTQQPSFNGFLIEDLPLGQNNNAAIETINGAKYITADLKKCILYPQQSGKLTITSGNYDVQLKRYEVVNTFWGSMAQETTPANIKVSSNSETVNIRPLPSPKPANFSGAVGVFDLVTRINPQVFKTYSPATYSIIVSGTGNLKYIQNPVVNMPKQFDTYDPQNKINMSPNGDNMSGNVRFDYMFIPQFEGQYKIPDSYFVYFNTETQQYDSIKVEGYDIKVAKGEGKPSEHYKLRNMDIRDIDKGHCELSKSQSFFITSFGYWFLMLLALTLMIAGMVMYRKIEKTHANTRLMRTRRASKLAQRRLKNARALMVKNDRNGFYAETLTALWGYLSDKLSIPVSELSKDNIAAEMESYGFSSNHIDDTMHMLETCEFAQYAPELEKNDMAQVYDDCAALIDNLEKVKPPKSTTSNDTSSTAMRSITLIIALLAMAVPSVASAINYVDQGNKAYETKHYREAIDLYKLASKSGVSSQLYYNMGNAYYRLNNRAYAVLCYERALKLDPQNSDARFNLEFIREKSQLNADNGSNYFSSLLGDVVSHASSNSWAVIGLIAFVIALAGIACYRTSDSIRWQKAGFFGALAMTVITIIAVICSCYMYNRCTSSDTAIIMVGKSVAKKTPRSSHNDAAFTLDSGVKVDITDSIAEKDTNSRWYKIETADGRAGWMKKDNFTII